MTTNDRNFLIYISEVGPGDYWESQITLNGVKIGGSMGPLYALMQSAGNRLVNAQVDREWYDPFVKRDEELVLYGEVAGDPRRPKKKKEPISEGVSSGTNE